MEVRYEIGGRVFTQRKLVLGQVKQIMRILPEIVLPQGASPFSILLTIDDKIYRALAVVLREEGCELKDKDVDALAAWLAENCDLETGLKVIADFFDLNPLSSFFSLLESLTDRLDQALKRKGGSTGSLCSSQEETSQSGMPSSGATLSRNAGSGPPIEEGKLSSARLS